MVHMTVPSRGHCKPLLNWFISQYVHYLSLPPSEVLECFKRRELLDWATFQSKYGVALREGVPDCPATGVFAADEELGREQWEDLRKRVIEHVSVHIF